MNWQIFIALLIAIPVIMLPAAIVWYFSDGAVFKTIISRIKVRKA